MSEIYAPMHHPHHSSFSSLNQAQHLPPACGARQLSKLKRFLTTIQNYAADISSEVLQHTRELMLALVNQQFSVEEFHAKMQQGINLPMRPFIIPFLKTNLPLLQRELFYCSQMSRQSSQFFLPNSNQVDSQTDADNLSDELLNVQDGFEASDHRFQQKERDSISPAKELEISKDQRPDFSLIRICNRKTDYKSKNIARELEKQNFSDGTNISCSNEVKYKKNFQCSEEKYIIELNSNVKTENSDDIKFEYSVCKKGKKAAFPCDSRDATDEQQNKSHFCRKRKLREELSLDTCEQCVKVKESKNNFIQTKVEDNLEEHNSKVSEIMKCIDQDVKEFHKCEQRFDFQECLDDGDKKNVLIDEYCHIQTLQKEIDMKKIELDRMQEEYKSRIKFLNEK